MLKTQALKFLVIFLALLLVSPIIQAEQSDGEDESYYDDEEGDEVESPFDEEGTEGTEETQQAEDSEVPEETETEETQQNETESEAQQDALLVHSSLTGETGLLHVISATSGSPLTFSASFNTNFFVMDDYLVMGDSHSHIGGNLGLRFTAWKYIEAFANISCYGDSNNMENPTILQTLGDVILGAKGFYPVLDWLYLGGGFGLYFFNQVGDIGVGGDSTSFALNLVSTFDIQKASNNVPLRIHLNLGYFFDNSSGLISSIEERRGGCDSETDVGCISRIERTSLNINRVDRFNLRLGIEAPLPYVTPFIEWNLGIPVNRQGFDCTESTDENAGTSEGDDSCLAVEGFSAFPQTLALGVRVLPPLRGLAINLAADIGLTGTSTFVHELAATAPYNIYIGISYSYDPRSRVIEKTKIVQEETECEAPPELAKIKGFVKDEETNSPIPEAIVSFAGQQVNSIATGDDGRFISYGFPAGEMRLQVRAQGYNDGEFVVQVPQSGEIQSDFALKALPRKATILVHVANENDEPVSGASLIALSSSSQKSGTTDGSGNAELEVDPGTYNLKVEAQGYMLKQRSGIEAQANGRVNVDIQIRHTPAKSLVKLTQDQIQIKRQVHFRTNSADIDPDSNQLLEEVADVLLRNPEICKIEVQGHTDNQGRREYNIDLSQRRADSVRDFLIQAGVSSDRIVSRGYGPDEPIAPNILPTGRAKNRRVVFKISERCPASPTF